jgi:hypothetical protein
MPENGESTKFTFHASSLDPTIMATANGEWIYSDHCQRHKEIAESQLLLWIISRSG